MKTAIFVLCWLAFFLFMLSNFHRKEEIYWHNEFEKELVKNYNLTHFNDAQLTPRTNWLGEVLLYP